MGNSLPGVDVLVAYCAAVDGRDASAVAEVFCEDGRAELIIGPAQGRDEIRSAFDAVFADDNVETLHAIARPIVTDAVEAPAERNVAADFVVWIETPGTPAQVGRGRYDAHLRAQEGRWLISELTVTLDGPIAPVAADEPSG